MHVIRHVLICLATFQAEHLPATADELTDLKVLYAGNPGSERAHDFCSFLKTRFTQVESKDFQTLTDDAANGYDLVIFDWTSIYPRDRLGHLLPLDPSVTWPSPPKLSATFHRPSILVGAAGGVLASSLRLKIRPLCLCLRDVAQDSNTSHAVFGMGLPTNDLSDRPPQAKDNREYQAPRMSLVLIGLLLTAVPAPVALFRILCWTPQITSSRPPRLFGSRLTNAFMLITATGGGAMIVSGIATSGAPAPAIVWSVQTRSFPDIDPGFIWSREGFDSGSDAEIISSGLNSKDRHGVALGRFDNFFVWGFSASPADMTPQAKTLFINVALYMTRHRGNVSTTAK